MKQVSGRFHPEFDPHISDQQQGLPTRRSRRRRLLHASQTDSSVRDLDLECGLSLRAVSSCSICSAQELHHCLANFIAALHRSQMATPIKNLQL